MSDFGDDLVGGIIGGAIAGSMANRRKRDTDVPILFQGYARYLGGHPLLPEAAGRFHGDKLVVREDGVELNHGEQRRLFIPAGDVQTVRTERQKHRLTGDENKVELDILYSEEPLTVTFRMTGFRHTKDRERFQSAVEAMMKAHAARAAREEPQSSHQTSASLDDLERLAELRDKGILTEEEFAAKKRQILGL